MKIHKKIIKEKKLTKGHVKTRKAKQKARNKL